MVAQDVVHAVEPEHIGTEDSAVMYIGAVPKTPLNTAYIEKQRPTFLSGSAPPDYKQGQFEGSFVGNGKETDIIGHVARVAVGLAY